MEINGARCFFFYYVITYILVTGKLCLGYLSKIDVLGRSGETLNTDRAKFTSIWRPVDFLGQGLSIFQNRLWGWVNPSQNLVFILQLRLSYNFKTIWRPVAFLDHDLSEISNLIGTYIFPRTPLSFVTSKYTSHARFTSIWRPIKYLGCDLLQSVVQGRSVNWSHSLNSKVIHV